MAHYRKIDTRIWNDAKFRGLSDAGKLCFIFVLTHPHLTALGAMRATVAGLAEELGWKPEAFREAFQEALSKGLLKHDPKACFVWIPNFLKYNGPESPNVVKSWVSALDLLPECNLKSELLQHVKDFTEGLTEGFQKALPEAFAKGMPYQEQEQEQEQDKEKTPSTTSQGSRGTKAKKARVDDLGAYPPELEEAHTLWRGLLRELKSEEIQSAYPPDKRFLPAAVGTKEASWRAWQPHLTKTVAGHPVTNADVFQALNMWAVAKVKRAKAGEGLACKMLPAMLNSADFVDGVVAAVRARIAQEVPHAS